MTMKILLVSRRQIKTAVNFVTVMCNVPQGTTNLMVNHEKTPVKESCF